MCIFFSTITPNGPGTSIRFIDFTDSSMSPKLWTIELKSFLKFQVVQLFPLTCALA
jgi:hypothetical protein